MPVEYWNPVPIYYADVSQDEFLKIRREIYDNITNDMYAETQWEDLIQTTSNFSENIIKKLNLINLQTLIFKHTFNFFSELKIENNFYVINSWFNILPKYGHQLLHTHTQNNFESVYSGVYFYDNTIEKMQPLHFELKNEIKKMDVLYEYLPGRILIFSGHLPHCVHFNRSNEPRKSFTFNVKLV